MSDQASAMSTRRVRRGAVALACVAALGAVWGQADSEARLKAQVLVKALRFVEWPPGSLSDGQPLQLCLAEDSALAQELRGLDGQALGRHALQVRAVRPRQFAACHVVLVGEAQLPLPAQPATLWVTESPGMLERGLMLSLQVEEGRVVFDVGLDATRRAGLDISAKLLRLARFVKKG
jgi:hypothetical protein